MADVRLVGRDGKVTVELIQDPQGKGVLPTVDMAPWAYDATTDRRKVSQVGEIVESPTGFWNNAAVAASGTSTAVQVKAVQVRLLVNVSAATDVTVQHSADGTNWYNGEVLQFTTAGSKVLVLGPASWLRLQSSQAATITAGYVAVK